MLAGVGFSKVMFCGLEPQKQGSLCPPRYEVAELSDKLPRIGNPPPCVHGAKRCVEQFLMHWEVLMYNRRTGVVVMVIATLILVTCLGARVSTTAQRPTRSGNGPAHSASTGLRGQGEEWGTTTTLGAVPQGIGLPKDTLATSEVITGTYLMSFFACNRWETTCRFPADHRVYLAQSDDGASWKLVPSWTPYQGSVPDVVRRGDTIYVYTPGMVRRYRLSVGTWQAPVPVTLDDPQASSFVDPSLFVDERGRLVLFYLPGIPGQDPARCAPGETACTKRFRSATEVPGSDGSHFVADPGDRVRITISASSSASDPDIFYDGERYVLYISRGGAIQVYTSTDLRGEYALWPELPNGYLTHFAGVGAGIFDKTTGQYWTFLTGNGAIRRAVHSTLNAEIDGDAFAPVFNAERIGLGPQYLIGSPGIALNVPGSFMSHTFTSYLPTVLTKRR